MFAGVLSKTMETITQQIPSALPGNFIGQFTQRIINYINQFPDESFAILTGDYNSDQAEDDSHANCTRWVIVNSDTSSNQDLNRPAIARIIQHSLLAISIYYTTHQMRDEFPTLEAKIVHLDLFDDTGRNLNALPRVPPSRDSNERDPNNNNNNASI